MFHRTITLGLALIMSASLIDSQQIVEAGQSEVIIAYYDEIKDLPNHPEKLLIDVRRPEEIAATGSIPTSINIPLNTVEQALSNATPADTFKEMWGRDKPTETSPVIFSCRSGVRAEQAYRIAEKLGYKNIKSYKGSWLEWAKKNNLPE